MRYMWGAWGKVTGFVEGMRDNWLPPKESKSQSEEQDQGKNSSPPPNSQTKASGSAL